MGAEHGDVRDYLESTRSVLMAGERLLAMLGADQPSRDYAATRLGQASQQQALEAATYRAFMFAELEGPPEIAAAPPARLMEDALTTTLIDLEVANVLLSAGQALGENGVKGEPAMLQQALLSLKSTATMVEAAPAGAGRLGFGEEEAPPQPIQSADLPTALEGFRQRLDETLGTFVSAGKDAVTSIITDVAKVDGDKVLAALGLLGEQIKGLEGLGNLFKQGVAKLQDALDALVRLVGSKALAAVKDEARKVWERIKEGAYVAQALEQAFGVEAARERIAGLLGKEGLTPEWLDQANAALGALGEKFTSTMALTRRISAGVGLTASIVALTPLAGPELALLTASVYALTLGVVVLIGRDYTDAGPLRYVAGVIEIAEGVQPAAA